MYAIRSYYDFIEHNPQSQAVGLDPSINMLLESKKKLKNKRLNDRIFIVRGIAEDRPVRGGVFDAVTISFGIRNTVITSYSIHYTKLYE